MRKNQRRVRQLPLWAVLLLSAVLSLGILLFSLASQPNALSEVLEHNFAQPLLFLLNLLPVLLLVLFLAALFGNVFFGASLAALAVGALSIANRIKLEVRDEPVFPRDLALIKEAGDAMGNYHISFPTLWVVLCIGGALVLLLLGFRFQCRSSRFAALRGWLGRLLGMAASAGVFTVLILTVYSSSSVYQSFNTSDFSYIPGTFNELGFPYCFCRQFTAYPVDKPADFSRAEAEAWDTAETTAEAPKDVHILMIMNEAFSDISDYGVFAYTPENDPLRNVHALRNDPHALSGHIVVPGFAGGTANTEFDVMTGMQTNALSETATSAFRVVNRNLDSVLRVCGDDGCRTGYYHPGEAWFYNRENVCRWMGAEELCFKDDMPDRFYKGAWVADDYMADFLEKRFEETAAQGKRMCSYTTTIQNHMSYVPEKYGADFPYQEVPLRTEVSPEVQSILSVYMEGARDADKMLGRLTAFFSETEEPVLLAYFGDHLPYLGDSHLCYHELGLPVVAPREEQEDPFCAYETPYVIWANDAAAELLDWENAVAALDYPEDGKISACYLGATLLELSGRSGQSPWFRFLCDLRREAPIVHKDLYRLADGSIVPAGGADDPQLAAMIDQWRKWSYYKLRCKSW